MAAKKKSKRKIPKGFPRWYNVHDPVKRYRAVAAYRADIKLARKYLHGFTAADGYDARKPWEIHPERLKKLRRKVGVIRRQLSVPHVEKTVARTAPKARAALAGYARQSADAKQVRKFIVPLVDPNFQKVRIKRGALVFGREVPGVKLEYRYFIKPRSARTWEKIEKWVNDNRAKWPKGQYSVIMAQHGIVSDSTFRDGLPQLLARWAVEYGPRIPGKQDTADSLVGFLWTGTDLDQLGALRASRKTTQQAIREASERERKKRARKLTRTMRRMKIYK